METVASYVVVTPVKHNGKRIAPGATIELTNTEKSPLLEQGIIKLAGEFPAAPAPVVPLGKTTLGKLTVAELTAYAAAMNVTLPSDANKDQILEAIGAAQPAPAGA
jgi:hypothetical protein